MRKLTLIATLLGIGLFLARPAAAQEAKKEMARQGGESVEFTAQVVDLSCKVVHNLSGDNHRECAQVCADRGIPLGLLSSDGTFYLPLSDGMPGSGQNERLKGHAEHTVKVKGKVVKRAGMNGIIIESITM
ncbi:MAG: hypothetical protein HY704_16355 [Gemmatimonadetes bacterium]|nr:hypothetical protein [Gemmatimonadota bacterium]